MAASIVSFGFVFLHPFMEGNGRLSRFLFHKMLCQSGQSEEGMLLPALVAMKRHEAQTCACCKPSPGPRANSSGCVPRAKEISTSPFKKVLTSPFRYWDATACVEFGLRMAREALELELRKEADFILHFDAVRKVVDEQYELRGSTLAALVSIALNAEGVISKAKHKRYADEVSEEIFAAIEHKAQEVLGAPGN